MDSYYPKARRPIAHRPSPLKRPPPKPTALSSELPTTQQSIQPTAQPSHQAASKLPQAKFATKLTYELAAKPATKPATQPAAESNAKTTFEPIAKPKAVEPECPRTPTKCRIQRPKDPPPLRKKAELPRRRPTLTVRELFKTVHPLEKDDEQRLQEEPKQKEAPASPSKIETGPLKGVSQSLLDLIRAKEAKVKETPAQLRQRELLGIAADVARIIPNIFTANKREVMPYDRVLDKCHKALRSNYSSTTISDCIDLMFQVAPEWVTVVEISRGKYMRINRDKYTLPQLLSAIDLYKKRNR